jgi:uncharacterized RDD family membrane protein YckC
VQKQGIWLIWIGSLAAMLFGSGWIATLGQWAFGLTLVAHIVEFIVQRSLFRRAGGSMLHHFVQTLIYGFFHWKPIVERFESQEPSQPTDR